MGGKIKCRMSDDGSWAFFWTWSADPISIAADLDTAVTKVTHALRPLGASH
jgi:hypothetical protein